MKIIELKAENIKKLVAVSIRPNGNLVEITGENGQGKTSVLDAILWALKGSSKIQTKPIRNGVEEARIRLDLGELVVTRKFKKDKEGETTSSLTVESGEGARFPSPQAMLDGLLGELAFDPLAFSRMKPREQFDQLKRFVPGVDFEALEQANRIDFDRRTALNRKAKEARTAQNAIEVTEQGETVRIDTDKIIEEITTAGNQNTEIMERKSRREATRIEIKNGQDLLGEITVKAVEEAQRIEADAAAEAARLIAAAKERAKKVITDAQDKAEALTINVAELQKKLDAAPPLPEPVDLGALREKLAVTMKKNDEIKARIERINKRDEADRLEAEASGMTEAIEAREKTKRDAIAAAKLPVAGLGFGDGIVTMNGVPFDQASGAEQLRTSIAIAMSLNPKLRVIRVSDGSLLDEKSLKLLGDMAAAADYQVWIERVDGSGKVGFVLEDGHIKTAVAV